MSYGLRSLERLAGRCTACLEEKDVREINIYTIGSEGTELCHVCEMELVHLVQNKRTAVSIARVDAAKARVRARRKLATEDVTA